MEEERVRGKEMAQKWETKKVGKRLSERDKVRDEGQNREIVEWRETK